MGVWDTYQSRLFARGATKRETKLNRTQEFIARKLCDNLSYQIASVNGASQQLAIINSDNLNVKTIYSLPGENIISGSSVDWAENHWIVTAVDPNNEVYTKASMLQCNHKLRWITNDGKIIERWCAVSDGTKYLTGETISSYNDNGMSLGDTRISVMLPRDEYTVKLSRKNRFLIDDEDSHNVLAYRLTKPFKVGGVYNGHGVMSFVMTEVNTEVDDNLELRIADYYKFFPRDAVETVVQPLPEESDEGGKKVWL